MMLTKVVNGKKVPLTDKEVQDFERRQAAHEEYLEEQKKTEYLRKREAEYPSIKEMVVAMWEHQMEENTEIMWEIQQRRNAVKAKYPKPEEA